MTVVASLIIVGVFARIWQHYAHEHAKEMTYGKTKLQEVEARVSVLERKETSEYNHAAFEDLKSKVEALRLSQGIRGR